MSNCVTVPLTRALHNASGDRLSCERQKKRVWLSFQIRKWETGTESCQGEGTDLHADPKWRDFTSSSWLPPKSSNSEKVLRGRKREVWRCDSVSKCFLHKREDGIWIPSTHVKRKKKKAGQCGMSIIPGVGRREQTGPWSSLARQSSWTDELRVHRFKKRHVSANKEKNPENPWQWLLGYTCCPWADIHTNTCIHPHKHIPK